MEDASSVSTAAPILDVVSLDLGDGFLLDRNGTELIIRNTIDAMISEGTLADGRQIQLLEQQTQRLETELGDRALDESYTEGD